MIYKIQATLFLAFDIRMWICESTIRLYRKSNQSKPRPSRQTDPGFCLYGPYDFETVTIARRFRQCNYRFCKQ